MITISYPTFKVRKRYIRTYISILIGDSMPAKVERKILKTGDSKAAALPPDWLRAFGINVGDNVVMLYNSIVIIKPKGFKLDPDFLKKEFDLIMELEKNEL